MDLKEIALNEGELTPQFLSEEEEALFAEAMMRQEAIDFLNSNLGRLLRGMALQDVEDAKSALLGADPDDSKSIRDIQFKAAVASQFLRFIQEVLNQGKSAEASLRQLRDEL